MRIIGGRWGGRRIAAPRGSATRPTTDRVREALFSILGTRVDGARVIDLCAGSGGLGFEALSRGAAHVTFVERDPATAGIIRENAATLDVPADAHRVIVEPAQRFLRRARERVDLVLCDPPWSAVPEVSASLFEAAPRLIVASGLIVIEHRAGEVPKLSNGLLAVDARKYGDTGLLLCGLETEISP